MKMHAIRSHYPLSLRGVTFEIPNATKCITVDRADGTIYAWLVTPDELCLHEKNGFWWAHESDAVHVGVMDDQTDFDWTKPLWVLDQSDRFNDRGE